MTQSDPVSVLQRMIAAFASGNAHDCDEYVAASYSDHQGRRGSPLHGPGGFRQVVHAAHRSTTPRIAIEDMFADETRAVARVRWHFGPDDDGSTIERETIEIIRVENGKAVEHWGAEAWSQTLPLSPNEGAQRHGTPGNA